MKRIQMSLAACALLLLAACGEPEAEEQCTDASQTCSNNSAIVIDATTCSDGEDVYYLIDGTKYTYEQLSSIIEQSCNANSSAMINEAGIAKMQSRMSAISSRLMIQARAAAGCE